LSKQRSLSTTRDNKRSQLLTQRSVKQFLNRQS
jgi:Ca2+-binding EF-hand superfamily protein